MEFSLIPPRPLWQRYLAVLAYLLAVFLVVQLIGIVLVSAGLSGTPQPGKAMDFRFLIYGIVIQMAGFLLPAPFLLKFTRAYNFTFARARAADILLCCGLIFASLIFFSVLYSLLKIEPKQLAFLDMTDVLKHKSAFVTITGILVPGYEEWIFRGLIFGVLVTGAQRTREIFAAGTFSALIFTASHIEGWHSLTALPPILAMAAIFQYMTWRSQSLWPAVCGHAMQNLLSSAAILARITAENTK